MARITNKFNDKGDDEQNKSFMQALTLKQGINKLGDKGIQAATDEIKQQHERQVFKPINMDDLTNIEKQRAMQNLIFLVEKRDQRIKK